jgi:hypothetical protein
MEERAINELDLMINSEKPLSMFYYSKALNNKHLVPIDAFSPYVKEGRIIQEEFVPPLPPGSVAKYAITYVLYALSEERWRIPAMKIALTAQSENLQSPDEGIDRIIGMLLGYAKADIDAWVAAHIESGAYNRKPSQG